MLLMNRKWNIFIDAKLEEKDAQMQKDYDNLMWRIRAQQEEIESLRAQRTALNNFVYYYKGFNWRFYVKVLNRS